MQTDRKLPARPPRGLIEIDGMLRPRRYGLLAQRALTCIYGHRIKCELRPFEIAIPCNRREDIGAAACGAHLYIFTTRAKLLWAMDVTHGESSIIDQYSMDVEQIIDYFGVGFPIEMKLARLKA